MLVQAELRALASSGKIEPATALMLEIMIRLVEMLRRQARQM